MIVTTCRGSSTHHSCAQHNTQDSTVGAAKFTWVKRFSLADLTHLQSGRMAYMPHYTHDVLHKGCQRCCKMLQKSAISLLVPAQAMAATIENAMSFYSDSDRIHLPQSAPVTAKVQPLCGPPTRLKRADSFVPKMSRAVNTSTQQKANLHGHQMESVKVSSNVYMRLNNSESCYMTAW
jgi:hypothetical protein